MWLQPVCCRAVHCACFGVQSYGLANNQKDQMQETKRNYMGKDCLNRVTMGSGLDRNMAWGESTRPHMVALNHWRQSFSRDSKDWLLLDT